MARDFDTRFELDLVAAAARDVAYRRQVKRILSDHSFTDERYGWLWTLIRDLPQRDLLHGGLVVVKSRKDFDDVDKRREYIEAAIDVLRHAPEAPRAAVKELEDYRDFHLLKGGIEQALKDLKRGRVTEAKGVLKRSIRNRSGTEYEYTDWLEDWEERQELRAYLKAHPEERLQVPLRFVPSFDRAMGGGSESGEVGLVVGTTGRGKSIFAANTSFFSSGLGFHTVYISTEMEHVLTATRLDARATSRTYDELKYHDLSDRELEEIDARFKRFRRAKRGRLRIVSVPVRQCTVEFVEQVFDDMEDDGTPVQVLVMDSGDHLTPSERTMKRRDRETAAYWDLKSLAAEKKIPVWSTTHAPKDVVNKIATAENVGESYDKARIADIVITLNQTKAQARQGVIKAYLAKYRQGKSRVMAVIDADLSRMHMIEREKDEKDEEAEEGEDE